MKKSRLATAVVNVLFSSAVTIASASISYAGTGAASTNASAQGTLRIQDALSSLEARFGDELVLVGQVDGFFDQGDLLVLGQRVTGASTSGLVVGDYVAVLGQPAFDGLVDGRLVYALSDQYVPGASRILIRGVPSVGLSSIGQAHLGRQAIDFTAVISDQRPLSLFGVRDVLTVVGTQPLPGGVVLALEAKPDGSLGTGRSSNGSLGTGKANGSLGTGKVDGSLGTG